MRGCVDRFLLFGIDEDVRDALAEKSECRATDRRLLHLVSLTPQTDLVCSFSDNLQYFRIKQVSTIGRVTNNGLNEGALRQKEKGDMAWQEGVERKRQE
ncbi:unnamed protein product [Gongylonema pulchrum]|uniref:CPSF_A domain-containing protein n=1 Tax=Gongylonema pulchrum TaxID=637853 RepID=A0A183D3M3_9BILA|nr:unnamed protein product [Gongylonema pulchrum]